MSHPAKVGRPAGLLMNPCTARLLLGKRPQSQWAAEAGVSTAHLSEMVSGAKGATVDVARRLADALNDDPNTLGALFPEYAEFRTTIRHFTASAVAA